MEFLLPDCDCGFNSANPEIFFRLRNSSAFCQRGGDFSVVLQCVIEFAGHLIHRHWKSPLFSCLGRAFLVLDNDNLSIRQR